MRLTATMVALVMSFALIGASASPVLTLPSHDQFKAFVNTKASQSGACRALMQEFSKLTSPPYVSGPDQIPFRQLKPSLVDWQGEAENAIDCLTLVPREGAPDAAQSVPRNWALQAPEVRRNDF